MSIYSIDWLIPFECTYTLIDEAAAKGCYLRIEQRQALFNELWACACTRYILRTGAAYDLLGGLMIAIITTMLDIMYWDRRARDDQCHKSSDKEERFFLTG